MEKTLYGFNASQDIIHMQTTLTLFKRVGNIVFTTTVDGGFDKALMTKALNLLFVRHDCLRLTFTKKEGKMVQYFESERSIGEVPFYEFKTQKQFESHLRGFRKKKNNIQKGETLKVEFCHNACGEEFILYKISHYVADTYAIGVLVTDLFAIYKALKEGSPLPAEPGKFEDVLRNDLTYKDNTEMVEKDREFMKDLYTVKHTKHPEYCGIHGKRSDIWMKEKSKGKFAMKYFFVKCDTVGYRAVIPASVTTRVINWCGKAGIPIGTYMFYAYAIAASLVNDRQKYQAPLQLLDCRGTKAERSCAGTKVQSISVYTTVDYDKSFADNVRDLFEEQNQLYRHTKLSYLEVNKLQLETWGHSQLSQVINFCYSFIPFRSPEGVHLQVHSNGKGALPAYIAMMLDVDTNEISVCYDIQSELTTAQLLMDFQNLYVHIIESVLDRPDEALGNIL